VFANIAFSAETYNAPAAAASGTIEGAAITIPPANIIVISVRLVNLRPISLFMLLVIFLKN
jgi:hypothetical protein